MVLADSPDEALSTSMLLAPPGTSWVHGAVDSKLLDVMLSSCVVVCEPSRCEMVMRGLHALWSGTSVDKVTVMTLSSQG